MCAFHQALYIYIYIYKYDGNNLDDPDDDDDDDDDDNDDDDDDDDDDGCRRYSRSFSLTTSQKSLQRKHSTVEEEPEERTGGRLTQDETMETGKVRNKGCSGETENRGDGDLMTV